MAAPEHGSMRRESSLSEFLYHVLSSEGTKRRPAVKCKERGESRVLVLYTGGTIGMMKNQQNAYVPKPHEFEKFIRRIPYMHDDSCTDTKFLVLPEVAHKTRILYHIREYSPLLDSSNMGMENWIRIGEDVKPGAMTCRCAPLRVKQVLVLYTGGTIGMKPNQGNALIPVANAMEDFLRQLPYLHDKEYARLNLNAKEQKRFLVYPAALSRFIARIGEVGGGACIGRKPGEASWRVRVGGALLVRNLNVSFAIIENNPCVTTERLENYLRKLPIMHDVHYAKENLSSSEREKFIALPIKKGENRTLYHIEEFEPIEDSANLTMGHLVKMSSRIENSYAEYDGFVILHGTDTLAYTASALSFMFENLGKTVVITGSQIPVFESRSDGRDNILGALVIAANYIIPEVTVFFQDHLYRGNRIMKMSTDAFHAFNSPNLPPLADIGINIEINHKLIFRPYNIEKFNVHSTLNPNVGLLRLFPNITIEAVKTYLQSPIQGVVLQTYGAGNIPSNRDDIMDALKAATKRGVIIVNCTQCMEGSVCAAYETGMILFEAGVIPGSDMTPEAALTKLSYVLSKDEWDMATKREMMLKSLRGELTTTERESTGKQVIDILKAEDEAKIESILIPAFLHSYSLEGNVQALNVLKESVANFSAENADFRTALHVAACEGNKEVVEYLLLNGASVHAKDRFDNTPLMDAITFDHHEIIEILVKCGAHLIIKQSEVLGEKLTNAAVRGDVKRLQSYKLAGADLSTSDFSGNTPLHVAALSGHKHVVEYLLSMDANANKQNVLGDTPANLAMKRKNMEILQLFT